LANTILVLMVANVRNMKRGLLKASVISYSLLGTFILFLSTL
jgi:hypothetical protein